MSRTIEIRCTSCGSTEVAKDAAAEWDTEKQDWVLSSTYDHAWCNSEKCDGEPASLAAFDAETGEELRMGPGSHEYIPKPEADALWKAERERWETERAQREAEQKAKAQIAQTAETLADAYQEIDG